jgi:hypothetical protein
MKSFYQQFVDQRDAIYSIISTLVNTGNAFKNRNKIPADLSTGFSAGVVSIEGKSGKDGTRKRYVSFDRRFVVWLIVDASEEIDDPDADLQALEDKFRAGLIETLNRDIAEVEYYPSYVDGSSPVMIAKFTISTEKS